MEILIGIIIGILLCYLLVARRKVSGVFTIDLSDSMNDELCGLTMYENLNEISMKKRIILEVKVITDHSPN